MNERGLEVPEAEERSLERVQYLARRHGWALCVVTRDDVLGDLPAGLSTAERAAATGDGWQSSVVDAMRTAADVAVAVLGERVGGDVQ